MFLIPASITTALTGKLYNTNDKAMIRAITARTVKITLYVCSVLSIAGLLLARLIPFVYGQAYVRSVPATMILMLGVVFASVGRVAFPYFYTLGRPLNNVVISFVTLLINIALNFMLIPKYGIYGAAIASSISYFIYGIYYIISFIVLEGFSVRSLLVPDREDLKLLTKTEKAI
jgi:O-antigen/teichoic acid export membrane protein